MLFGKLSLPVVRRTKTGPSTDADTLEELAALHPVPAKIVEFRALSKLQGTYIDALPALVNPATGRLHTSFNQAVAATGRLSSSDPNLQNIPIRTELGRRIREAFVAKPGHLLVSADYSQIELRILAHFSQDPAFLEAFRSGQDIHQRTAAEVFGVPLEGGHGRAAAHRQGDQLRPGVRAERLRPGAGAAHPARAGPRVHRELLRALRRRAGVHGARHRRRARDGRGLDAARTAAAAARDPRDARPGSRLRRADRAQHAHPGLGRRSAEAGDDPRRARASPPGRGGGAGAALLLTVHDELVFEVPEPGVPEFKQWVKNEMETVYELAVPLVVDVGAGATWGAAH